MKKNLLAFITLIGLLSAFQYGYSQTIFHNEADTYVHSANPDENWGSDVDLYSVARPNATLHIYVRFDVSGIETVNNAFLRLFVSGNPSSDYRVVHKCSDISWDEMQLNWNNKPEPGDSIGFFIPHTLNQWVEINVSEYVQEAAANGKITFVITTPQSLTWNMLSSKEKGENIPTLAVNFTDDEPPTQPTDLTAINVTPFGCTLGWTASSDNVAVHHYVIFQNGTEIGTTTNTFYNITNQIPETSSVFTVVAKDNIGNASPESDPVTVNFPAESEFEIPSPIWKEAQAEVIAGGDLKWAPKPFEFKAGSSIRYIDYENGDDTNDGLTRTTPWKHHPWDANATANAMAASGIHTYVFKRGVVYRGILHAMESGSPQEYINLTSDPEWGEGEAMFFGSHRIEGGWVQADTISAPRIPDPHMVWYVDLPATLPETKKVAEIINNEIKPLNLAQIPNWEISDSLVPMDNWWRWTGVHNNATNNSGGYMIDTQNLTQTDPDYWTDGTVWSEWQGTMGTVWNMKIASFNPDNKSITTVNQFTYGGNGKRYYIENLPQLLDTVNEYWFDKNGSFPGRLYVRLAGDKNPNDTQVEVAVHERLINLVNKNYISISGLTFALNTYDQYHFADGAARNIAAVVNLDGYCHHIEIRNCNFFHVNAGIVVENSVNPALNTHNIKVSDNHMRHVSDKPIVFSSGDGKFMEDIFILRNKIYNNGFRQLNRWYSAIPSIAAYLKTGVVAGNIIDYSWGAGVYLFWGKGTHDGDHNIPFIRGFVYHNRADNTLLGTSDWGGIEHWQGGPVYYYNNFSRNAHGWGGSYQNNNWNPWGFPFYFDGSFKLYAFNNIAVSPFNDVNNPRFRNRSGYQLVLGMFNTLANNTSHNFFMGITTQQHSGGYPVHNAYLGNILSKTSHTFIRQDTSRERIVYDSFSNNIFDGNPPRYWDIGTQYSSFGSFQQTLQNWNAQVSQLGWDASFDVLSDPDNHNFLPALQGEAIDRGVKFFAPFPLNAVVGEWHFYKHAADSSKIVGENFFMTTEYNNRNTYDQILKNHLKAENLTSESFVMGDLEDWTEGVLVFDGVGTYCHVANDSPQQALKTNNLNMTTHNFIIEVYLRTDVNHTGGTIVSKYDNGSNGYALQIDNSGNAQITLIGSGADIFSLSSSVPVNDGNWHHVLAEVNRTNGINIYINGELKNGLVNGTLPSESISLTNNADFLVGKNVNDTFFAGAIDFLRISKGDLIDARTTIDELYDWQFDGPFLYDFAGNAPQGKRDAGALEAGEKICAIETESSLLNFDSQGGSQTITIIAQTGFQLVDVPSDFASATVQDDKILVSVTPNEDNEERKTLLKIFGCNETIMINIVQDGTTTNILEPDGTFIHLFPNPASTHITVRHNIYESVLFELYNLQGQKVFSENNISKSELIDISSFRDGFYIIKISDGTKTHVFKLIKK